MRFLNADPGKRWWEEDDAPEPAVVDEAEQIQKAGERFFLSRKVQRLEEHVKTVEALNEALKRDTRALKKKSHTDGRCDLFHYAALAKKHKTILAKRSHRQRFDHDAIANWVDKYLAARKIELRDACPKHWISVVPNLPRLLVDARKHPKLAKAVKTLIAQAE